MEAGDASMTTPDAATLRAVAAALLDDIDTRTPDVWLEWEIWRAKHVFDHEQGDIARFSLEHVREAIALYLRVLALAQEWQARRERFGEPVPRERDEAYELVNQAMEGAGM